MTKPPVAVNQTFCQIIELNYSLAISPCDQCGQPAARFTTATRTAIDLHLEHPVLLHLTVSVHHCCLCRHFFRAQPPFLRPGAVYTNRMVAKAVAAVYQDQMPFRLALILKVQAGIRQQMHRQDQSWLHLTVQHGRLAHNIFYCPAASLTHLQILHPPC